MKPITIEHMQFSGDPKTKCINVLYYPKPLNEITLLYSDYYNPPKYLSNLVGAWKVKIKTN